MHMRRTQFILFAAVLLFAGCRPKQPAESTPSTSSAAPHPAPVLPAIARVHWVGMNHLSRETNAAHLMAVWNLPESRKLEQQTLDKLSLAPWQWLHRATDTNAAALLRPLLDDVMSAQSCLEIQQATNQPGELAFAIHLDGQHAALWQTNLARVLESLTGIPPVPAPDGHFGWALKKHHDPNFLELTRVGDWTIIGAAHDHNGLLDDFKSRLQHGQSPVAAGNTDDWLAAEVDPALLVPRLTTLNFELSTLNRFYLSVTGDGTNVLVHGTADFSQPLALDLKPWDIPADLIDERLASFTIIRGFKPWLESSKAWNNLQIGPPPGQICFWAEQGLPNLSYFSAPCSDASNQVDRLADLVMQKQHSWFPPNGLAKFERATEFNGLQWKGLPYMMPFLRSITVSNQNFIYGGGIPNAAVTPLSLKTLQVTLSQTNLVYHDWEITGPRIEQWIFMGQFARYVSGKAQMPFESPGLLWLKAIAPKLGESVTDINQTGPSQLSFTRRSALGFTAVELNLLADWLESPQFPVGLHTFLAPPPPM